MLETIRIKLPMNAGHIEVSEAFNGFYITLERPNGTRETRGMGDGVEMLSGEDEALCPGTPEFNTALTTDVTENWAMYTTAYFADALEEAH